MNVITRRSVERPTLHVQGGSFGLASGRGEAGFEQGSAAPDGGGVVRAVVGIHVRPRLRERRSRAARTSIGDTSSVSFAFLRKEFGANNFYGGNAPSREWTNQTLLSGDHQFGATAGWTLTARGSYRTHGDHFIFNQTNPALSDNRHRTHAVLGELAASRRVRRRVGHGRRRERRRLDPIDQPRRSRPESCQRLWRVAPGRRPAGAGRWGAPRRSVFAVRRVVESISRHRLVGGRCRAPARVRGQSVPRADVHRTVLLGSRQPGAGRGRPRDRLGRRRRRRRVPPRRLDAAGDVLRPRGFTTSSTGCARRLPTAGRPTTFATSTRSASSSARRRRSRAARSCSAQFTGVDLDAAAVTQLSKYVLDYAPRSFTAAAAASVAWRASASRRGSNTVAARVRPAPAITCCSTCASAGASAAVDLFVEGSNLLDASIRRSPASRCRARRWPVGLAFGHDSHEVREESKRTKKIRRSLGFDSFDLRCLRRLRSCQRFLLRQAMQRAQPPHQIHRVDADHAM